MKILSAVVLTVAGAFIPVDNGAGGTATRPVSRRLIEIVKRYADK